MVLFTFFFVLYCISPICQERLVIFNNPSLGSALDCRGQGPGTLREADPETQVTTMQGGQQNRHSQRGGQRGLKQPAEASPGGDIWVKLKNYSPGRETRPR